MEPSDAGEVPSSFSNYLNGASGARWRIKGDLADSGYFELREIYFELMGRPHHRSMEVKNKEIRWLRLLPIVLPSTSMLQYPKVCDTPAKDVQ